MSRISAADLSDGVRALSEDFSGSITRAVMRSARPQIRKVEAALRNGDVESAKAEARDVRLGEGLKKSEGVTRRFLRSVALAGAGAVVDPKDTAWAQGALFPPEVEDTGVRLQLNMIGRLLRQSVEVNVMRRLEAAGRFSKRQRILNAAPIDPAKLANDINRYLRGEITRVVDVAANIVGTRVSAYGMLYEARVRGYQSYRIDAILDDRTTDICRHMDGRTFRVQIAFDKTKTVLTTTDPERQKQIAPFPDLEEIRGLTSAELQEKGFDVPPFHFLCRSVVTLVDEDISVETDVLRQPAIPQADDPYVALTPPAPPPQAAGFPVFSDPLALAGLAAATATAGAGGLRASAALVDTALARFRRPTGTAVGPAIPVLDGEILDAQDALEADVSAVVDAAVGRLSGPRMAPALPGPGGALGLSPPPSAPLALPAPPTVALPKPTPAPDVDVSAPRPRPRGPDTQDEDRRAGDFDLEDDLFFEPEPEPTPPTVTAPPPSPGYKPPLATVEPLEEVVESIYEALVIEGKFGAKTDTDAAFDYLIAAKALGPDSPFTHVDQGSIVQHLVEKLRGEGIATPLPKPRPGKLKTPPPPEPATPPGPLKAKSELGAEIENVLAENSLIGQSYFQEVSPYEAKISLAVYLEEAGLSGPLSLYAAYTDDILEYAYRTVLGQPRKVTLPEKINPAPRTDENPFGEFEDHTPPARPVPGPDIVPEGQAPLNWQGAIDYSELPSADSIALHQKAVSDYVERLVPRLKAYIEASPDSQTVAMDMAKELLKDIELSRALGNSDASTYSTYVAPALNVVNEIYPEFVAVREYTGSSYRTINKALRGDSAYYSSQIHIGVDKGRSVPEIVERIDSAFREAAPLEDDLITWRGAGKNRLANAQPGQVIQDYGFSSASLMVDVAADFTGSDGLLLKILIPKGSRVIPVDTFSMNRGESEVLLPRSAQFRIVGEDEPFSGRRVLRAVYIGQGDIVPIDLPSEFENYPRETPAVKRLTKAGLDPDHRDKFVWETDDDFVLVEG